MRVHATVSAEVNGDDEMSALQIMSSIVLGALSECSIEPLRFAVYNEDDED